MAFAECTEHADVKPQSFHSLGKGQTVSSDGESHDWQKRSHDSSAWSCWGSAAKQGWRAQVYICAQMHVCSQICIQLHAHTHTHTHTCTRKHTHTHTHTYTHTHHTFVYTYVNTQTHTTACDVITNETGKRLSEKGHYEQCCSRQMACIHADLAGRGWALSSFGRTL
jgi:hypothetical protein